MDDTYFQELADRALTVQEMAKVASDSQPLPQHLVPSLLAAGAGGLGGGLAGWLSSSRSADQEERLRRGALLGALLGLGGYGYHASKS